MAASMAELALAEVAGLLGCILFPYRFLYRITFPS
jgi:hypothetical protein